jgi:hypothetical protein
MPAQFATSSSCPVPGQLRSQVPRGIAWHPDSPCRHCFLSCEPFYRWCELPPLNLCISVSLCATPPQHLVGVSGGCRFAIYYRRSSHGHEFLSYRCWVAGSPSTSHGSTVCRRWFDGYSAHDLGCTSHGHQIVSFCSGCRASCHCWVPGYSPGGRGAAGPGSLLIFS